MKFLVIIATFVTCCYAAPTLDLQHPSPINPSVLVELKPQEKESKQNVYALPDVLPHHITKRDHKSGQETKAPEPSKKSPQITKNPAQKSHLEPPKPSSSNKRNRRHTENYQQPQTLTAILTETTESTKQEFQKPQTLPAILTETAETSQQQKRDIPVPLVPKHQHPEESTKDRTEENKKDNNSKEKENHPNKDDVQVKDLSEPKPLHQALNINHAIPSVVTSTTDKQKPVLLIDPVTDHIVSSSTEHPFLRQKPVPVAELFARGHDD